MSVKVMTWVWEESPAAGSALLLMLAIADFADDEGIAFPSVEKLVRKTRTSRSSVFRALRALTAEGWLKIDEHGTGRNTSRYQIVMDKPGSFNLTPQGSQSDTPRGSNLTPQPSQDDTPGVADRHPRGSTDDTPGVSPLTHRTVNEPSIEKEVVTTSSPTRRRGAKRPPANTVADRFDDFWKVYPKRQGKGDAEKAWTKAVTTLGVDPQVIIDAALVYAFQRKGQDPKWTKQPASWLNGRRWEDEPDPAYTPADDMLPGFTATANGRTPWRNPTDPSVYYEAI